jgi:hypothetical protein
VAQQFFNGSDQEQPFLFPIVDPLGLRQSADG